MLLSLALKELRETAWIVVLALAAYLYCVAAMVGAAPYEWWRVDPAEVTPFVDGSFLGAFAGIAAGLAVLLALRQSLVESLRGTFLFLLHRPAERRQIIGTKLGVGLGLYLLCSAVPILLYSVWAATPGTHDSPFEWSMTLPTWQAWLAMTILYLATFLTGIRPARWFGTRVLPLAAGAAWTLILVAPPWRPGLFLLAVLPSLLLLVASILYVAAARDY